MMTDDDDDEDDNDDADVVRWTRRFNHVEMNVSADSIETNV